MMEGEKQRMIVFRPDNPHAWVFMPTLIERIVDFSNRVPESHTDTKQLAKVVAQYFAVGCNDIAAIGWVQGEKLIGHVLWQLQEGYGANTLLVLQYVLDVPISKELHEEGIKIIDEVAKQKRCDGIIAVCPSEAVARAHRIYHGFRRYATMMIRDVEQNDGGDNVQQTHDD